MPKLPTPSAREVIRALSSQGFQIVSQKGSHIKMKKITPSETRIVIVPDHPEIPAGTLKSIIRQAGMGRVPELLINSEKASTSHVFNEYIERFLRFQFSMIQTHDPGMTDEEFINLL